MHDERAARLVTIIALLSACAGPAAAQPAEVSVLGGYRFGGSLVEAAAPHRVDSDGAPAIGIVFDLPVAAGTRGRPPCAAVPHRHARPDAVRRRGRSRDPFHARRRRRRESVSAIACRPAPRRPGVRNLRRRRGARHRVRAGRMPAGHSPGYGVAGRIHRRSGRSLALAPFRFLRGVRLQPDPATVRLKADTTGNENASAVSTPPQHWA